MAKRRIPLVSKIKDFATADEIRKNIITEGVATQEGEIQVRRKSDGYQVVLRKEV